jgi:hypothetical protein
MRWEIRCGNELRDLTADYAENADFSAKTQSHKDAKTGVKFLAFRTILSCYDSVVPSFSFRSVRSALSAKSAVKILAFIAF